MPKPCLRKGRRGHRKIDIPEDRALKAVKAKESDGDKCELCILHQLGISCYEFVCSKNLRGDGKDVYFKLVYHKEAQDD